MLNYKIALVVCLMLCTCFVQGADIPRTSERDSRIQYVEYRENDIVLLNTLVGKGSRIVFSEEESIINIAAGYTGGWQLVPVQNELFISAQSVQIEQDGPFTQPVPGEWDTNLMVTTSRGLYDFEIKLLDKDGRKDGQRVFYRIEFEYADDVKESALTQSRVINKNGLNARVPQRSIETIQTGTTDITTTDITDDAVDFGKRLPPRNDEYSMSIGKRSSGIVPSVAYDDGLFTYLKFENNLDIPSAYLVRSNGDKETESLINGHVDPDRPEYIVLHRVTKKIRLRLERAVVDIYNDNFNPSGVSASSGTTVPGTKRVLKAVE